MSHAQPVRPEDLLIRIEELERKVEQMYSKPLEMTRAIGPIANLFDGMDSHRD